MHGSIPGRIRGVVWDWGDTLMRDIPGQLGPMAGWPEVWAMPGARDALEALSGCPVQAVATNAADSSGDDVATALERVGLRRFLTHFFTSGELGSSKPAPEFFLAVAKRLDLSPEVLLAVGNDLKKDVEPAKAVGMTTVLVSREPSPDPSGSADLVVPDLHHLCTLLGGSASFLNDRPGGDDRGKG